MANSPFKIISKLFGGSQAEKEIKNAQPKVDEINAFYEEFHSLSNDELRNKTKEFQEIINTHLSEVDREIEDLKKQAAETDDANSEAKDELYNQIDALEKNRNEQLEEVLETILPQAFATVKQTAKRFTENKTIVSKATELDKELVLSKEHLEISGEEVTYHNSWKAAGADIEWNMIHYDVQLIGGMVLHNGKIAEMATGEGKTLVSTLPAYLNALGKRGVHLVTVNNYLATRDCEWNAPIFNFLGLTVDCLEYHRPNSAERREAYLADITYGTNNEFGFDYLRDNMAHGLEDLVQRKHHYAMIDEVDSVLIDDARTPLIISGPTPKGDDQQFISLKPQIQQLVDAQKKLFITLLNDAKKLISDGNTGFKEGEGGLSLFRAFRALPKNKALIKFLGEAGMRTLLTKVENNYLQDQQKEMPKADLPLFFTIDEKTNSVDLTDKGIDLITKGEEDANFFIMPDVGSDIADIEKGAGSDEEKAARKEEVMNNFAIKSERLHSIQQLLKAYALFERDQEYVLMDGKVKIVDEQTGRIMEGRRYSDGLHQAIEAKENVKVEAATQTYATITLQNYFRMYHKLSGMTGTAETEAQELWDIYKLGVQVIPTNRPIQRKDMDDLVYKSTREKFNAVIDEIVELTAAKRPVLVGTTSVEISEVLARMLKLRGIKHNVLNAKQHQREAQVVAEAGYASAVTIATNMAGRGTDIKLSDEVKEAGGLAIIGTERHESRRVDRQLRGRSGRQGDPGSSRFYVSLEDDLMRKFGAEKVSKMMDKMGYKEGDVIEHRWMTKTIERNQKRMEQMSFGVRKRLLEYDDVMNQQRTNIYKIRKNALTGDRLSIDLRNMMFNYCAENVGMAKDAGDFEEFKFETLRSLAVEPPFTEEEFNSLKEDELVNQMFDSLNLNYKQKWDRIAEQAVPVFKNIREKEGERIENVLVPLTDGINQFQIAAGMQEALDTGCKSIIKDMEKIITLQVIDEEWKEHLRELDDLKQSSNNASIEQKDPILIYKIESFKLFGAMLNRVQSKILSYLFRSQIHSGEEVSEAKQSPKRVDPKVTTSRENILDQADNNREAMENQSRQRAPQAPLKSDPKVGRNDPCPCGSGKKFKQCHGKMG